MGCSISQASASVLLRPGERPDGRPTRWRGPTRSRSMVAGRGAGRAGRRVARGRGRVRRRREIPGAGQMRAAALDGVQGRAGPGAGQRGERWRRAECTNHDSRRNGMSDETTTAPASKAALDDVEEAMQGRRRPRAGDQRRRPRPRVRHPRRRRERGDPRHDAHIGGVPADRRDRGPDARRRSAPARAAAWSTTYASTGCGCRRGARTRSPTRAASSCGRSASTSDRHRTAPPTRRAGGVFVSAEVEGRPSAGSFFPRR